MRKKKKEELTTFTPFLFEKDPLVSVGRRRKKKNTFKNYFLARYRFKVTRSKPLYSTLFVSIPSLFSYYFYPTIRIVRWINFFIFLFFFSVEFWTERIELLRDYGNRCTKRLFNKKRRGFVVIGCSSRDDRERGDGRENLGKMQMRSTRRIVKEGAKSWRSCSYRGQVWSPAGRFARDKPRPFAISNLVVDGA